MANEVFEYDDVPDESVILAGEPSRIYDQMPADVLEVKMESLKPFLMRKLFEASTAGHLGETARHYVSELEKSSALDKNTLATFKQLADEAHTNRHDEAALKITNGKIRELVGTFTVTRRKR